MNKFNVADSPENLASENLAAEIPDGSTVATMFMPSHDAMTVAHALIRRGAKGLHLINVPASGLFSDLLIGAGCVASITTAGVTLGEVGLAPCFTRAVKSGTIEVKDASCPAILAAIQAGMKGIPFIPLRGLIGSDVEKYNDDFKIIDNPFAENDPIVVLKAINPDVALFHAALGDRFGNVWVGRDRDLLNMAHAAQKTWVTVDAIYDGNLMEDEYMAAGTLPAFYISQLCEVKSGSWPFSINDTSCDADAHLASYVKLARTEAGFAQYLDEYVM